MTRKRAKKARTGFAGTLIVALVAAASLVAAAPAGAADIGHGFSTSFSGSGTNALSAGITGVDVDNSSGASHGDVYVADANNHRIEKFDAAGNFILMFGDEVNTAGGDVCTAAESCKAGVAGSGASQLSAPNFIAVDGSGGSSAGDIYVLDSTDLSIHKYDEHGALVTSWGTAGMVTSYEGEAFAGLAGVDVGSQGEVVVFDQNRGSFYIFTSAGVPVKKFGEPCRGHSPNGIAVDATGTKFFKVNGDASVERFVSETDCHQVTDYGQGAGTTGLNLDPTRETLYRVEGTRVGEWRIDATDHVLDAGNIPCPSLDSCPSTHDFGSGEISAAVGIGINEATNFVYVADAGHQRIAVFSPLLAPLPVTEEPIANTTVGGTVKPDGAGEVIECFFEYGKATESGPIAYTDKKACAPGPNYTTDTKVSAALEGLEGEQDYNYRLVAKNANGAKNFGANKILTPHNVKGLKTEDATAITRTTAELHASFEGDGTPTTYFFEWGTGAKAPFTNKSTVQSIGSPTFPPLTDLHINIEKLAPQTVYRFRVAAQNSTGFSPGKTLSFETLPAVPGLETGVADEITQESFTLHGEFDGNGEDTHYYFEYGPTTAYGEKFPVPEADAGSPTGPETVSYVITEFTGYTTYHYRIVATNPVGKTFGKDMGATTLPAPLPEVAGVGVSGVAATEATINASITPNHWDTVYRVQYGTDSSYGSKTLSSKSIGHGATPQAISETLTELVPGTTYHYRVQATNFTGTTYGPDLTFITHNVPGVTAAAARATGATTAHLSAEAVPNGAPTQVRFRFGPTAGYGGETTPASIGEGFISQETAVDLTGLTPATTYHVQIVATNALGSATSSDLTLTTDPAAVPLEEVKPKPKPSCKKGFVRKNGKCVKKHKKQHRKHHKSGAKA